MNTALLELTKPTGDRYLIHAEGMIQRMDMPFTPTKQWRLIGITLVTGGPMIAYKNITPEWLAKAELLYKNGKPRYTVVDFDHGSQRVWGNTEHHGIKSLRFLTPAEVT